MCVLFIYNSQVFVPIQKQEHWWACVCDLDKKKKFVLNSSVDLGVDPDHVTTTEIVWFFPPETILVAYFCIQ